MGSAVYRDFPRPERFMTRMCQRTERPSARVFGVKTRTQPLYHNTSSACQSQGQSSINFKLIQNCTILYSAVIFWCWALGGNLLPYRLSHSDVLGGGLDLALTTLSDRTLWRVDSSPQHFAEMILSNFKNPAWNMLHYNPDRARVIDLSTCCGTYLSHEGSLPAAIICCP
jgi:hypothetical protein